MSNLTILYYQKGHNYQSKATEYLQGYVDGEQNTMDLIVEKDETYKEYLKYKELCTLYKNDPDAYVLVGRSLYDRLKQDRVRLLEENDKLHTALRFVCGDLSQQINKGFSEGNK